MGKLTDQLGNSVYLDTNIVVYAVEGFREHESIIREILGAMDDGTIVAVTSELTLAEVLIKPIQDEDLNLQKAYRAFLEPSTALALAPVTLEVLLNAAAIRAATLVKLPDAIQLATAQSMNCDSFLTNDKAIKAAEGINIRLLSELN